MPTLSNTPPTGPLCTRATISADLRALGIRSGDTVLVHSSLGAMGWVCGGGEAVVRALRDVLHITDSEGAGRGGGGGGGGGSGGNGDDVGTLVVPTHTSDNSDPAEWSRPPVPREWWDEIRRSTPAYNPRTSRSRRMGVIAETVRTWPRAVRSEHPQTSFAALGPQAEVLMRGHALDSCCGEQSPLAKLERAGAKVLLLGVGWGCCTAFHLAEYRLPSPGEGGKFDNSFAAVTEQGEREWMTVRETVQSSDCFKELGEDFEDCGDVVRGKVGAAECKLFEVAKGVEFARRWLLKNRPSIE